MAGLFEELKRRNVVRVGAAYIVLGWVTVQIAQLLFEAFGTPDWVIKTVIVLIAIGFPFALLFAWAFELTPEGLKKTREVDLSTSITHNTGRKLDFVIIAALAIALVYFIWERQTYERDAESLTDPIAAVPEQPANNAADEVAVTTRRSIAVLPFVNMSSDEEQEYFADGLTEEILNSLAKAPDLLVAARTSSFGFKGSTQSIPEIATALGVDHVLEGSVRRGGETLRITAQLIRANDGFHLWSETYDRTMDDIIAIQEEIAVNIANALETAMDPEALAEMMSVGTTSVAAYEALISGRGMFATLASSGDVYEILAMGEYFDKAIEEDPDFSEAHYSLYNYWSLMLSTAQVTYGITELPREEMRLRQQASLENAIRTATDDISAIKFRTQNALLNFDYRRALRLAREYHRARPNDDNGEGDLVEVYRVLAMREEVAEFMRAKFDSGNDDVRTMNRALQGLRRAEDMEFLRALGHETLERYGDQSFLLYQAHRALLWAGDVDGAARTLPSIRNSDIPEDNRLLVELRQACAESKIGEASRIYERLTTDYRDSLSAMWLANKIYGNDGAAVEVFRSTDDNKEFDVIADFLTYPNFDPTPYPNFMARVAGQGLENREMIEAPYRCSR